MEPLLIHAKHGNFLAYPTDKFLGEAIIKFGEYSELEMSFLHDITTNGTVIEVGANAGYLTVPLALKHHVIAIEPQDSAFELLGKNLDVNNYREGGVTRMNCASGSQVCIIDCPVIPYSTPGNHGGVPMGKASHNGKIKEFKQIPCVTLDSMNIPRVELIKADVEGMELQVLKGARELILRDSPILYVENDRADKSQALIEFVRSLGYWCAWHTPPLFNPDNFFRKNGPFDNPWGNMASINMVCLPKGRRLPPGVAVKHGVRLVEDATLHPTTSPI